MKLRINIPTDLNLVLNQQYVRISWVTFIYKFWKDFMKIILVSLIAFFISSNLIYSQAGGYGALFLLRSSSPSITAVGGAGVALPVNDAMSLIYNPANLGMNIRSNNFMFSYNTNENEYFQEHSIPFNNVAVNFGYNLESFVDIPIYGGIAYTRRSVDLGTFTRTAENGQVLGRFDSKEWSNELSIAISFEYYAVFSFGMTYKMITSELNPINMETSNFNGKADAFDIGFLAKIPVIKNYELFEKIDADLDFSIGTAILNSGSDLSSEYESDPLPRQSSLGYSLSLGFDYKDSNFTIKCLNIDLSVAAISNLVRRDSLGWEFVGMYKELNIIDNLFAFKNSGYTKSNRGIRLTAMEFFTYSFGWGDVFGDDTQTAGFEFSSKGITKYLYHLTENNFFKFFNEHLELSYTTAYATNPKDILSFNHKLDESTNYSGFNIMYRL